MKAALLDFNVLIARTNPLGKFRIGDRSATGDFSERTPHLALKRRAGCLHGQQVYRAEIFCEVAADSILQAVWIASLLEPETILTVVKPQKAAHAFLMLCPIGSTQISIVIGYDEHLADGRVDSIDQQLQDLTHASSWYPGAWPLQLPRGAARHRRAKAAMTLRD